MWISFWTRSKYIT
jgi:hypothetical protein